MTSSMLGRMQEFLELLRDPRSSFQPIAELVNLAGRLCQDMQDDLAEVQPLFAALLESQLRLHLLENVNVDLLCACVLIQQKKLQTACQLLESYQVPGGSKELEKFWNYIHYHMNGKRLSVVTLTCVQRFYCRKRNLPPDSICPEGLKSQHYPREVFQRLEDFALAMTTKPSKIQQSLQCLAGFTPLTWWTQMNLTTEQVKNWIANYHQCQKTLLQCAVAACKAMSELPSAKESHEPLQQSGNCLGDSGFV